MALQQTISAEMCDQMIGRELLVVVDRKEGDYYVARSQYSSPEVDPEVLIPAQLRLRTGCFYRVKITDANEFDLYGEIV